MTQLREHGLPEHPPIARPDELARVRVIAKLAAGLRAIMDRSEKDFLSYAARELDPFEYAVLAMALEDRSEEVRRAKAWHDSALGKNPNKP